MEGKSVSSAPHVTIPAGATLAEAELAITPFAPRDHPRRSHATRAARARGHFPALAFPPMAREKDGGVSSAPHATIPAGATLPVRSGPGPRSHCLRRFKAGALPGAGNEVSTDRVRALERETTRTPSGGGPSRPARDPPRARAAASGR